jgi:hypothetical protein
MTVLGSDPKVRTLAECTTTDVPVWVASQSALGLGTGDESSSTASRVSGLALTFDSLIKRALGRQVGDPDELEAALSILLIEDVLKPRILLGITHGTANFVAMLQELVSNVGAQQAVGSGDEHSGALGYCRILKRCHFLGVMWCVY